MTVRHEEPRFPAEIENEFSPSLVRGVFPPTLLSFNRAGVLAAADVHVASCLGRLGGDDDELVALGAAFAVRAPRVGHVYVDLETIRHTAAAGEEDEVALQGLSWPEPRRWVKAMASSPLVSSGGGGNLPARPLVLEGSALYVARLWHDEVGSASLLSARASVGVVGLGDEVAESLSRLFPGDEGTDQRAAAASLLARRLTVVAGGPGTGKTTTVARALGVAFEDAERRGVRPPLVALSAPTGKAAARLAEAVHEAAADLDATVGRRLAALEASTVHRLLGSVRRMDTRFRHHGGDPLPYDIVVVDETSMLPLWLMARLLDAVRPDAHLVLLGDPDQLASVEAGVVLADIVGPAPTSSRGSPVIEGVPEAVAGSAASAPISGSIATLRVNHRFRGVVAELAGAIRAGDADRAIEVLNGGDPDLRWERGEPGSDAGADEFLEQLSLDHGRRLVEVATSEGPEAALDAVEAFRLLCGRRRGPTGASRWNEGAERLVAPGGLSGTGRTFFVGRPVIVTANDYDLRLFNGDVGVVVPHDDGLKAVFRRGQDLVWVSPSQLSAVGSVYAMTVHKAQGSEFGEIAVVLPEPSSRILTRELLYTAVTRARCRVSLVGSEEAVRVGIERRIARASGLMRRLWGGGVHAR